MLHKTTDGLDDAVYTEKSGIKDCEDDFQEQGYLWLCGACENQPTFETIYELFHHKKSHKVGFDKTKTTKLVEPVLTKVSDCDDDNNSFESDELLKISKTESGDFEEKSNELPCLDSPTPSCSSEDIPLANLLSDNSQSESLNSKKSKIVKGNNKKVKIKNSLKSKNEKVKAINKVEKIEDELISDLVFKTEQLTSGEDFNDLKTVEEKESEETINIDKSIVTDENNKETENEDDVKDQKDNSGTKPKLKHICKICNSEFPSRFALTSHKKTHLFEDTGCYKCETCGKMCPKYDNFTRHLTIHSSNRQKNHQCTQCFAAFYNYADLKRHMVLHLTVKPFKCEHCGEGFIRQDNLLIHEYKHTGIQYKKFACKDCDKVLNSPSALVMHAKTHSEKTVFCPEPGCKFSCYLQSQLRQHLRKHSGEKPFQCAKCGRCFARSNDMKNHILNVHEGIKPFKCSSCPKKFALIGNLKNHKITHTNERPFLCAQCGKSFNQSSTLRKHSIIMHSPCRANGKPKKSKKSSITTLKGVEESKRSKAKYKELPERENKEGKSKDKKIVEDEGMLEYKIEKPKPVGGYVLTTAANITGIETMPEQCAIVHEIPREVQIQVPQITVSLPIQLDHSQTFILPAVKLEPSLIKSDIKKELTF